MTWPPSSTRRASSVTLPEIEQRHPVAHAPHLIAVLRRQENRGAVGLRLADQPDKLLRTVRPEDADFCLLAVADRVYHSWAGADGSAGEAIRPSEAGPRGKTLGRTTIIAGLGDAALGTVAGLAGDPLLCSSHFSMGVDADGYDRHRQPVERRRRRDLEHHSGAAGAGH
jgi:hypothetical protein